MSLTDAEAKIVKALDDALNEYLKLPIEHPTDQSEFCQTINACPRLVLARAGRRQLMAIPKTREPHIEYARRLSPFECGRYAAQNGFGISDAWALLSEENDTNVKEYSRGMNSVRNR